ncbi:hypothetical protein CEE37_01610 [candidate division LCP-89 bacterium B3_LCP]|uniref:Alkyl hydroperoxide reductase subunit C/ Thiol specific antioxidant domain-containing protein n=1 Tax=candidate division LCP-89 bacterium B3_LCP TaxID=2012998 RepID=A0A532V5D5_UNCL8|nr:MAG: hypothetical protein CEE37_01610 [candidate division LCP-89 bacterium B3_LCP]
MSNMLKVGSIAPKFELPGTDDKAHKLTDFRSKKSVVLVFYPKDNTSG